MLLGVPPGLFEVYHTELAVLRQSQHNLRVDATEVKCLTEVKNELRREIADRRMQLQGLKSQWGSPHSGAQIEAEIEKLEVELAKFPSLTVVPTGHFPRGMIARISLRLLGGTAAHYASDIMCRYPECTQMSSLAALKSEHTPSGWGGHSRNTVVRNSP